MITEKIIEVISVGELPTLQKNMMIGFIKRAENEQKTKEEVRALIKDVSRENKLSDVVLSTDEVKIYKVYGKDEWDIKYPFRIIYTNKNGDWVKCGTVSPTFDTAILAYLQHKHLGLNNQFAEFAMKMLGITLDE